MAFRVLCPAQTPPLSSRLGYFWLSLLLLHLDGCKRFKRSRPRKSCSSPVYPYSHFSPQPRKKYPCIPLSQSDFRSRPWPLLSLVPQTQCISNSALSCPQIPPLTPACREPGYPTASAQQTVCRSSLPASPLPLPSGLQKASCV